MKSKRILLEVITAFLVLLFVYTPTSKLISFDEYKLAMAAQPLAPFIRTTLIYALPAVEYIVVVLLIIPRTRRMALYASLVLLSLFTGYIILIQVNYYGRIPCTCGGIIQQMSWEDHLLFNIAFILATILAIQFDKITHDHVKDAGELNYHDI
ncbi:MAG TPA: MauE/DoxX family redox-associated membrane protein [Chitinophaga sp.]|uniref:MauE/DoxX family redox-associated membrane protein n=1 Tax=Chitinophaga sp. TaxID=1869181 RepID=UPI002C4EA1D9|nr:MauE/DoxX family redox-associated membrane protein [Chitinophaga sp.]HVI47907.1 MauE/DoxX family redox-associated membrane protein [Chitinophaga sp.]